MVRGQGLQAKVHYKGKDEDFVVMVEDVDIVKKWKNDRSIPLVDVVNSFTVFTTDRYVLFPLSLPPAIYLSFFSIAFDSACIGGFLATVKERV